MKIKLREEREESPPDLSVAVSIGDSTMFDIYRNADLFKVHLRIYPITTSVFDLSVFTDVKSGLLNASFDDIKSRIEYDLINVNGLLLDFRCIYGGNCGIYSTDDLPKERDLIYKEADVLLAAFGPGN